jgi:hypothetical protein
MPALSTARAPICAKVKTAITIDSMDSAKLRGVKRECIKRFSGLGWDGRAVPSGLAAQSTLACMM